MSQERYPIPAARHRTEIEILRSRFIATVAPAESVEAAQHFLNSVRDEFREATHNCWAWLIGPPGSTDRVGMSDDGEPHGTAGRPMLNVLSHADVGDVAVVVTRFYGGKKLGRGGLVKAYSDAVVQVLATMPRSERVSWSHCDVELDYAAAEPFKRMLDRYEAQVLNETFDARVTFRLRVPETQRAAFEGGVREMSNGTAIIRAI